MTAAAVRSWLTRLRQLTRLTQLAVARRGAAGESGQIMLLTLAYALIALSLVLVIASASAVHLERKQLLALADGAALDAADAIDLDLFYGADEADSVLAVSGDGAAGVGGVVPLSDDAVRRAVAQHIQLAPSAAGLSGLVVGEPTGSPDGVTAQVTLGAVARPPLIPWVLVGWSDGIALSVTSTARAG